MSLESLPKNVIMYMLNYLYPYDLKTVRFVSTHFKDIGMIVLAKKTRCITGRNNEFARLYGKYFNRYCVSTTKLHLYTNHFPTANECCLHIDKMTETIELLGNSVRTVKMHADVTDPIPILFPILREKTRVENVELILTIDMLSIHGFDRRKITDWEFVYWNNVFVPFGGEPKTRYVFKRIK